MNPDQRTMLIWGAILGGVLLIGWGVLDWRGDIAATSSAEATRLIKRYDESHPATGLAAGETRKRIKEIRARQETALNEAEAALAPLLPTEPQDFTNDDLNAAEGTFREVVSYLEHKAERQNVKLAELPLKTGLDSNPAVRRRQLAQVYLVRGVLDSCIDSGVAAITSVTVNPLGFTDPGERYALFTCEVACEGTWKNVSMLIDDLSRRQQRKGYGLRAIDITQQEDGSQKIRLVTSLITINQPDWGLKPEGAKAGAKPSRPARKSAPAANNDGGT